MAEIQKIEKELWYVCTRDEYTGEYPDGDLTFKEGHSYKGEDILKEYSEDEIQKYYLRSFRLWIVQDAKLGDFLTYSSDEHPDWYFIFQGEYKPYESYYHYYAAFADEFIPGGTACIDENNLRPSTQKERELLLLKIQEAGYQWDEENCKLIKTDKEQKTKNQTTNDQKKDDHDFKTGVWFAVDYLVRYCDIATAAVEILNAAGISRKEAVRLWKESDLEECDNSDKMEWFLKKENFSKEE